MNDFFERGEFIPFNASDYDQRELRADKKRLHRHTETPPVAPEFQRYFGSRLHDSYVIATERDGAKFTVRLAHDGTEGCIAEPISRRLNLPPSNQPWPIHLVFSGVTYVRWAKATKVGGLQFAKT